MSRLHPEPVRRADRTSRRTSQIELSGLLTTEPKPLMILDNACGGSALATFTMFELLPEETMADVQIVATDKSSNAVCAATGKLGESQYPDHVMTLKLDMQVRAV